MVYIKYKKLQKQLQTLKKFQRIVCAIRFFTGGNLGLLKNEIQGRFPVLSNIVPIFNK